MAGKNDSVKATVKRGPQVKAEDFALAVVEVHKAGGTLKDVADKLKMKLGSVNTRLCAMRKSGKYTNIPSFSHNRGGSGRKVNVDAVNAIFNG